MSTQPNPSTAANTPSLPKDWSLGDVIDLEYFLDLERTRPPAERDASDRAFYRRNSPSAAAQSGGLAASTAPDRRRLFLAWVAWRRREMDSQEALPGPMAEATWRIVLQLLLLLGVVTGAATAAALLRYDGVQPVNVAAFLGWLVIFQIGLLLLALSALLLRLTGLLKADIAVWTGLLQWLWCRLTIALHRHAFQRLPVEQRARLISFLGVFAGRQRLYGAAFAWPLLAAWQRFGVGFNLAALTAALALILFSDRAFGWQSAANIPPAQVHRVTKLLSAPWSWLDLPSGSPTRLQIEGSRIVLKDGIKQLATADLVAWWPFLCLALLTYGLLPRLALWIVCAAGARRALRRLNFHHAACDRLLDRMAAAELSTAGSGADPGPARASTSTDAPHGVDAEFGADRDVARALAFVDPDLLPSLDASALTNSAERRFRWRIGPPQPRPSHGDAAAWPGLSEMNWSGKRPHLLLIEEAWQPPIAERIEQIRRLRRLAGPDAKILVALIGRPQPNQPFTAPNPAECSVWIHHLNALRDPHLRVEPLVAA